MDSPMRSSRVVRHGFIQKDRAGSRLQAVQGGDEGHAAQAGALAEKGFHEQQFLWEAGKFFDEIVQPALNSVAVELRKNGRSAEVRRLPSSVQISSPPVVYTVGVITRRLTVFVEIELFGRKSHTIRTGLLGDNGRSRKITETTQDHVAEHFVDTYTKYI